MFGSYHTAFIQSSGKVLPVSLIVYVLLVIQPHVLLPFSPLPCIRITLLKPSHLRWPIRILLSTLPTTPKRWLKSQTQRLHQRGIPYQPHILPNNTRGNIIHSLLPARASTMPSNHGDPNLQSGINLEATGVLTAAARLPVPKSRSRSI